MSVMTTTKNQPTTDTITADDLTRLRDEEQNSWAKVAEALGLGSPGAARRTYTQLVRPHTESVLAGRTTKGGQLTPLTLAGATLAKVQEAIVDRTIVVQRKGGTEAIRVAKVQRQERYHQLQRRDQGPGGQGRGGAGHQVAARRPQGRHAGTKEGGLPHGRPALSDVRLRGQCRWHPHLQSLKHPLQIGQGGGRSTGTSPVGRSRSS